MEALLKVALEKLEKLNVPLNKRQSILLELLLAVFNEVIPDELELKMSLRQDLETQVITLLGNSDESVQRMLNLVNQTGYSGLYSSITDIPWIKNYSTNFDMTSFQIYLGYHKRCQPSSDEFSYRNLGPLPCNFLQPLVHLEALGVP